MFDTSNIRSFLDKERGATMVEYGIMVVFVAAACIFVVRTLGLKVHDLYGVASGTPW